MKKREVKKSVVSYDQRERSREKVSSVVQQQLPMKVCASVVDSSSRRARLEASKRLQTEQKYIQNEIDVKIQPAPIHQTFTPASIPSNLQPIHLTQVLSNSDSEEEVAAKVMHKPIFLARQYRKETETNDKVEEQIRRQKSLRYTTKLLLHQNPAEVSQDEGYSDEDDNNTIDDTDGIDEEYQYQLWRVRELKRIRKEKEERQMAVIEKVELQRRRAMNNQQILLQNRLLGADSTAQEIETKYIYMQKYYHKGAFYQDSDNPILKRDYNLPTPLQMQDKTMLPELLQKRIGNFGKKGQSKYKHLTVEDTTDTNPLTRPDESLMSFWKNKTGGYKGNAGNNV